MFIVKGNGKAFTSGLDLMDTSERYISSKFKFLNSFGARIEAHGPDVARKGIEIYEYLKVAQSAYDSPRQCKIPVIAAIHGY